MQSKKLLPEYTQFDELFHTDLNYETKNNKNFREVISTTPNMQLVLMSMKPNTNLGPEIHPYITQFIKIEQGNGYAMIENHKYELFPGAAVIIPLNTIHDIYNTSKTENLKLYTVYSPPNHSYNKIIKDQYMD